MIYSLPETLLFEDWAQHSFELVPSEESKSEGYYKGYYESVLRGLPLKLQSPETYFWLVGNGGMGYNYNYYFYHSLTKGREKPDRHD